MILYFDGKRRPYPVRIQAGDVLCIAGRDLARSIPFEHVAVVAEPGDIASPNDWLKVRCYGLPESISRLTGSLTLSDGSWWLKHVRSANIGSVQTVWNLAGRADEIDEPKARVLATELAYLDGLLKPKSSPTFNLVDLQQLALSGSPTFETNCLGWVCSVHKLRGITVFSKDFPSYLSPYTYSTGVRLFPSPGHLFHAFNGGNGTKPYMPRNSDEAQKYAPAAQTSQELQASSGWRWRSLWGLFRRLFSSIARILLRLPWRRQ